MALALAAVVVPPPAALAADTLDQSQTSGENSSLSFGENGFDENRPAAQTFTAGLSGGLDRIDAYLRLNQPLTGSESCNGGSGVDAAVRTVAADGSPSDTTLAGGSAGLIELSTEFGWVSVEISPPAPVTAGTRYALVLSTDGSCSEFNFPYNWGSSGGDPYAAGRSYGHLGSNWIEGGAEFDQAFKTYVDTSLASREPPPQTPAPPASEQTSTPSQPPSPQPPPAPSSFARTLSISHSSKRHAFRGMLRSESPPCVSGQKILHFEKKKGRDPKVGSAATYASGRYSIRVRSSKGSFYARAATASAAGATCLAATSKTIRVG
jgi:hypothetical protein